MLLLHGGAWREAQGFNQLLDVFFSGPLEEDYALVYWDQRMSGSSTGTFPVEMLTMEQYVADLDALIELLKTRYGQDIGIFLMGHSWGGNLGSAYITTDDHADKLKGWINVAGSANNSSYGEDLRDRFLK